MDRFLQKPAPGVLLGKTGKQKPTRVEAGEDGGMAEKRPRREPPGDTSHQAGLSWRQIRGEGLNCDYTILFGKAEADKIFRELEQDVEYFTGLTLSPKPWLPVLERIRDRVSDVTGQTFNFVLVNRYKDGCDHIGEHRDDERELAPRTPIASVSFGACRDFFFRHKASRGKPGGRLGDTVRLQLAHGSLLMMNHPTNTHWYHSLPVRKKVLAPRVNLTFRKILPKK
ncbi:DNA oxidative demethylase ALKBH2 isoform X2 [Dipodomys spectabilis]|uniref:DNA oxidative demethylase ALKBH2 isoform X2 n=1 Tax=Dipodomys spectabilis TaxID=105255 RepID=UPI001C53896B|nr:DNA oxidative demethylase ALKBH2 isoform X2 [Dipodomys spectabilis]